MMRDEELRAFVHTLVLRRFPWLGAVEKEAMVQFGVQLLRKYQEQMP
jgi:hypothetical protein